MKQLLTYYSSHRDSCGDTQDLYLGFEEAKPLISLINQVQILMKDKIMIKQENGYTRDIDNEIDNLLDGIHNLLHEDVIADLKQKKLIK
jgi:hypothetical protein